MKHDAGAKSHKPGGAGMPAGKTAASSTRAPSPSTVGGPPPMNGNSSSASAANNANGTSPADAILRAIQSGARRNSASEIRESTRFHYCVPMTLHIDDPKRAGTRVIRAASSNVSNGGFAFIFDAALSPGSTVRAQFESLPGKPQIAGIVRSCVYICGTQHRIGVEYQ